jgi:hypothetical protein
VIPADGGPVKLHAYFDATFGGYSTVYGAIYDNVDPYTHEPTLPAADPVKGLSPTSTRGSRRATSWP